MNKVLALEIEYLLNQESDDLFQALAEYSGEDLSLLKFSKKELIEHGKKIFRDLNLQIKESVCCDSSVRKFLKSENREQEKLTIALIIAESLIQCR
jgi:hypothetical protein